MENQRYDSGRIQDKHVNSDGFLNLDATVTRTGVFKYRMQDGSILSELRHPDDVLKADSLKSMEMLPITLNHPSEKVVNAKNFNKLAVGFTGEKVTNDGRLINTNLKITNPKAIESINNDETTELSLGYSVILVPEIGEFNGERYDCRQTEIKYNHLALVKYGRAGHEAKLHLDSGDAIQHIDDKKNKNNSNSQKEKNMNLVKVTVGSLNYDAAPEVEVELKRLTVDSVDLKTKLDAKSSEVVKVQAKLDEATEKLTALEAVDPQV